MTGTWVTRRGEAPGTGRFPGRPQPPLLLRLVYARNGCQLPAQYGAVTYRCVTCTDDIKGVLEKCRADCPECHIPGGVMV